jgi:hypothetical protein
MSNFLHNRRKEIFLDDVRASQKIAPITNHVPCNGLGVTTQINPRLKRVRKDQGVVKFLEAVKGIEFISTKIHAPNFRNEGFDKSTIKGYL